ncbi:helix-turn-helix domain-containing protein [Haloferax profundi]|uniref:Transcriptional regulator n=1 Tax=Haloferax profundi TaxID=1544718 RepID=A0A0W1RZ02_9EURY|nr:helix-turn-helix domain-containing protein [Haloferax profundi]KTG18799.1 transcriptional regulator [Haloferax profundi]
MKSLRLRLHPDDEQMHPMHAFVVEHEAFEQTRLLHWNPAVSEVNTIIFEVVGTDVEAYRDALDASPSVLSYEVVPTGGETFYLSVQDRLDVTAAEQTTAFTQDGLVVVPPVVFDGDGSIQVTVVGTTTALQSAVDETPDGIDVEVLQVRQYAGETELSAPTLSRRQREAVDEAVACGYYREPREGTVSEVADRLGCSAGTAAEHLRKAEMKVMSAVADECGVE